MWRRWGQVPRTCHYLTMARAHHHHSVPESYLRGWSHDRIHVMARRLLVPSPQYPEWGEQGIRSLTAYEHLYTSVSSGVESDELEIWLNKEFDSPGAEALSRVRQGAEPTPQDLQRLAFLGASLDVRTPVDYLESKSRWERDLPKMMAATLKRVRRQLARAARLGQQVQARAIPSAPASLPVRVTIARNPDGGGQIKAEITAGRELWLHKIRHVLSGIVNVLRTHEWRLMHPHTGLWWFTSDHPMMRLNFNSESDYDFGGGWGHPGSDLIFPLSPELLLYTQVGRPLPDRNTFTEQETRLIQRLLARRAFRWIIAREGQLPSSELRHRTVDKRRFVEEESAWKAWHQAQSDAETGQPRADPGAAGN